MKIPTNYRALTNFDMDVMPATRLMIRRGYAAQHHMLMAPNMWRDMAAPEYRNEFRAELEAGYNSLPGRSKEAVWYSMQGKTRQAFERERYVNQLDRDMFARVTRAMIQTTGFFIDTDQSDSYQPFVVMLAHGRALAAYYDSACEERIYFQQVHESVNDAAVAAFSLAEQYAEVEYAHNERWNEAWKLNDDRDTAMTRLRECIKLRHVACMNYVRSEAGDLVKTIRDITNTLKREYDDIEM